MEGVWSQYERMESELSVIRSHLQHVCNFGGLQVRQLHLLNTCTASHLTAASKVLSFPPCVVLPGALSGPEGAVDDGGHLVRVED